MSRKHIFAGYNIKSAYHGYGIDLSLGDYTKITCFPLQEKPKKPNQIWYMIPIADGLQPYVCQIKNVASNRFLAPNGYNVVASDSPHTWHVEQAEEFAKIFRIYDPDTNLYFNGGSDGYQQVTLTMLDEAAGRQNWNLVYDC